MQYNIPPLWNWKGKTSHKKFKSSRLFREQAEVFDAQSVSSEEVIAAGEHALVCIYNGKPGEVLDSLRYKRYTSHIQPQTLPPTSAAAKYHSLREYSNGTIPKMNLGQWNGGGDGMYASTY